MTGATDPAQLLEIARRLCVSTEWSTLPWSTRAVALLVRQSVETWLGEYWAFTSPVMTTVPRRAQFLMLHDRLPAAAVAEAHGTWSQLSHACHHRVFDLEPSRDQAVRWIEQAERFRDALLDAHHRRP